MKKFRMTLSRKLTLFIVGLLMTIWLAFGAVLVFTTAQSILTGSYLTAIDRAEKLRTSSFLNAYPGPQDTEDWWVQYSYQHPVDGIVYPSTNRNPGRYTEYTLIEQNGQIKASTVIGIRLNQTGRPSTEGVILLLDGLSAQDLFALSQQIGFYRGQASLPPLSASGTRDGCIFKVNALTMGGQVYSTGHKGGTDTISLSAGDGAALEPHAYTLFPEHLDTLHEWEMITEVASQVKTAVELANNPHYLGNDSWRRYLWAYASYDIEFYPNRDPERMPLQICSVIISTPLSTALEEHTPVLLRLLALIPLLGLLFSSLLRRMVVLPLKKTQQDFDRVAKLDFRGCEGDIKRQDEIGDLNRNIRQMAAELQKRWDDERALEARRQEFVAAASHELKTPLALLSGYTEAVAQDIGDRDRYLAAMEGEIDRMNGLVMELLDQTRLERMEALTQTELVDLTALVQGLLRQTTPLFTGLDLRVRLEPKVFLHGDGPLLERAVGNLLSNAAKYCRLEGRVAVALEHSADGPVFWVENEAEPIPQEELPWLFEPFYRGDKARDRSGSGMGLAIAQKIFTLHHLACRAENTQAGVRFTVSPAP